MNYEEMKKQCQELQRQKNVIAMQIDDLKRSMAKIESDKAEAAYNEILERLSVLTSCGYVLDVKIWNNECGDWDWDTEGLDRSRVRLRRKDTIIV